MLQLKEFHVKEKQKTTGLKVKLVKLTDTNPEIQIIDRKNV